MSTNQFFYLTATQSLSRLSLVLVLIALGACQSTPNRPFENDWTQGIVAYKDNLDKAHPDSTESILNLDLALKQEVIDKFKSNSPDSLIVSNLARWLLSQDGHGMRYDVSANLNPMQAYHQKKGNCLSFTLLFVTLAAELGIDIKFNMVDLPNMWGTNSGNDYILYRHINAILITNNGRQIFDLANELYDFGYPQRIIPREHALAQLHSNKAIDELIQDNFDNALHLIKLAISLSPQNEDLWVNLGAILTQKGNLDIAEQAFLYAYSLNSSSEVAASRLERFYASNNQPENAKKYQHAALKARQSNPYYLYEMANSFYQDGEYKKARSEIKKAIRLHAEDPNFYELSALIAQQLGRHDLALKYVITAYQLSHDADEQIRYAYKARLISKLTTQQQINRQFRSASPTSEKLKDLEY